MLDENVFALDEERSELFATKKMVASLKSKMAELERDKSGSQRGHKDQLYMVIYPLVLYIYYCHSNMLSEAYQPFYLVDLFYYFSSACVL